MPNIIDTHAHLYDLPDPVKALSAAAGSGVTDIVVLGVDLGSNQKHIHYKGAFNGVGSRMHLALGLHPGNIGSAEDVEACLVFMRKNIGQAIAIGEAGLDYWYKWVRQDEQKKKEQREVFERQLALAVEFDLPVVIHSRGACQECLDMAQSAGIKRADFHWYSGSLEVLKQVLDAGYFVSVSPALEYSPESRRTAEYVPLDRLLVETDTPVSLRMSDGSRIASEPKDVWRTFKALCLLKDLNESEALRVLNDNARALFNIAVL